jgi:hypothetical protein
VPGINIGNRAPGQQGNICIKKVIHLQLIKLPPIITGLLTLHILAGMFRNQYMKKHQQQYLGLCPNMTWL